MNTDIFYSRKVIMGTFIALLFSLTYMPQNASGAFMSTTTSRPLLLSSSSSRRIGSINQGNSKFIGTGMKLQHRHRSNRNKNSGLKMFLGSDGILGVGAPEIAVTLLVGYFILGPSELYKLTKEIGKFIQSFRTLSSEASKSFESSMENQLELQELRKAQTELNNAFSFRRSINVDEDSEAFSEKPPMVEMTEGGVEAGVTAAATGATVKKKKKRRRVKKKVIEDVPITENIPDLDLDYFDFSDEFKKELDKQKPSEPPSPSNEPEPEPEPDWYSASENEVASEVLSQQQSSEELAAEQSRFASQLSGNWNDQILANEDKLSPLAKVMEQLALLEEEKNAADVRLEEEFRLRAENEEKYYREKRSLLEQASVEISTSTYDFDTTSDNAIVNGTSSTKDANA